MSRRGSTLSGPDPNSIPGPRALPQLHSPLQSWPVRGLQNSYNSLQDLKSQGPHSIAAPRALEKTQRSKEVLELAGTQVEESKALKRAEEAQGVLGGAPTTSPV